MNPQESERKKAFLAGIGCLPLCLLGVGMALMKVIEPNGPSVDADSARILAVGIAIAGSGGALFFGKMAINSLLNR